MAEVKTNFIKSNIIGYFKKDFKLKLIVALGLAGMALILLSQIMASNKPVQTPTFDTNNAQFTSDEYILQLEDKLKNLLAGIEGVGKVQVMITLENGGEYVYAQEEKRNTDSTSEQGVTQALAKTYQKENVEQKYILIDSEYGKKQALVLKELQPKVKGVVVVCEGAANVQVKNNLINVVTTALDIPTTRVCVVKISKQQTETNGQ